MRLVLISVAPPTGPGRVILCPAPQRERCISGSQSALPGSPNFQVILGFLTPRSFIFQSHLPVPEMGGRCCRHLLSRGDRPEARQASWPSYGFCKAGGGAAFPGLFGNSFLGVVVGGRRPFLVYLKPVLLGVAPSTGTPLLHFLFPIG